MSTREIDGKFSIQSLRDSHFWWLALPFIGLILWGALCLTNNLWYDEAYSAALISNSWTDMVRITAADAHSPFYYALLKAVYHLAGGGTIFWPLKMLSLLFMFGYLLLGKYYVKKLFDEKTAVFFMAFSIMMPIMTVQAGNVRMYAASLFFMTLTGLSAYDIYREENRKKWIIFCIGSICTVYCHTFSMIQTVFYYIIFILALLCSKQYKKLKGVIISGVIVAVIYLPWLVITWMQMQSRVASNNTSEIPTVYSFMDYCMEWFSALESPVSIVVFTGMAITVFLGYYAVDRMRSHKKYLPGLGMAALGLTAITGVMISLYITPSFMGRYIFSGFGALALTYAVGMRQIGSVKIKLGVFAAMLFCFLIQYKSELQLEYDNGLDAYHAFLSESVTDSDCMMGPSEHTLMLSIYQTQIRYFLYGHLPERSPFLNTEAFTRWEQLEEIEGNIWYICFQGDSPHLLSEVYSYEEVLSFHYMYYDFVVYQLIPWS